MFQGVVIYYPEKMYSIIINLIEMFYTFNEIESIWWKHVAILEVPDKQGQIKENIKITQCVFENW